MNRFHLHFALLLLPLSGYGMSEGKFWNIIEGAKNSAGRELERIPFHLGKELAGLSLSEVVEFKDLFQRKLCEAHSWPLWGAAYIINGGASDDGFEYFKMALIAYGKHAYQIGLKSPDDLGSLDLKKYEGFFELEEIDYVPDEVFKSKSGTDLSYKDKVSCLEPKGKAWKEDELPGLFPKLSKKFKR